MAECPANPKSCPKTEGPVKCTWYLGTKEKSPHSCVPSTKDPKVKDLITGAIGNTPMVRINHLNKHEPFRMSCEILAKCEFLNPGGSVKDRIGKRMFDDAEASGRIKPGDTIIEPTSGNTGIGLALCAAAKGYRMIVTLPEKMSQEKVSVLKALGAEIVRTPTEAAWDSPESHIGVAKRLNKEIPHSHILDQYGNPSNPLAHYDGLAEEILDQTDGHVDMMVIGVGTGGTLTGVARKFKERLPTCKIIGVDPVGSILALPDNLNDKNRLVSYKVEGTGYDFIPTVLDRELVDEWIKTDDEDSFLMARRLINEEGMLCGGSSGASMWAALTMAQKYELNENHRVVVVLPDNVRNYMTKFISDTWMVENKFLPQDMVTTWWSDHTISQLQPSTPATVSEEITCAQAVQLMQDMGFDQFPVLDDAGEVLGVVTEKNLSQQLLSGRLETTDLCSKAMYKQFRTVSLSTPLKEIAHSFDTDHYAIVTTTQQRHTSKGVQSKTIVSGIVTRLDLMNYICAESS